MPAGDPAGVTACRGYGRRMRIGVFGDKVNSGSVADVVAEIRRAEQDGFAAYWAPQIFGLDTLSALTAAGMVTERIELGTSVVPTYPRHPMMLAQQALTVSSASNGRLCLGIGLSHQVVIEAMMGLDFSKPVRHLREYLSVLGPLLTSGSVAFEGQDYRVHAGLSVSGIPPVPVVVAALGTQTLRVAAHLAQGTITWCTGPRTLAEHTIPTIVRAAEEAGRPAPRIVAALPVCVTDDVPAARQRAATMLATYGTLPSYRAMLDREGVAGPADIAICGSAAEVAERIAALAEIGVTDFGAVEFGSTRNGDWERTRELLATLV